MPQNYCPPVALLALPPVTPDTPWCNPNPCATGGEGGGEALATEATLADGFVDTIAKLDEIKLQQALNAPDVNPWGTPSIDYLGVQGGLGGTAAFAVAQSLSGLADGNNLSVYKHAVIAASASGHNLIVAAVAAKRIVVIAFNITARSAACDAQFKSNSGGTNISGLKSLEIAGDAYVQGFNPAGHFKTAVGHDLSLNLSVATEIDGELTYVEID